MRTDIDNETMGDSELQKIIHKLDKGVPKDGAKVKFRVYGGAPDESCIDANKPGYMRLGIELLKAAFAETRSNRDDGSIDIDITDLISEDSEIYFDEFRRLEMPADEEITDRAFDFWAIVIVVMIFSILGLAVTGLVAIAMWIF